MRFEFLMSMIFISSVLTNVTVEGIKALLNKKEKDYSASMLAVVVSIVITIGLSVAYIILNNIVVDARVIIEIIGLVYAAFLTATVGYDKVLQTVSKFKK